MLETPISSGALLFSIKPLAIITTENCFSLANMIYVSLFLPGEQRITAFVSLSSEKLIGIHWYNENAVPDLAKRLIQVQFCLIRNPLTGATFGTSTIEEEPRCVSACFRSFRAEHNQYSIQHLMAHTISFSQLSRFLFCGSAI